MVRALCVRSFPHQERESAEAAVPAYSGPTADIPVFSDAGEIWTDTSTKLTWTLRDNAKNIDWNVANLYCGNLRLGGFADWRLPSSAELRSLFDEKIAAVTPPTTASFSSLTRDGTPQTTPVGTTWVYHIKGRVVLTTGNVWSSDRGQPSPRNEAVIMSFQEGKLWQRTNDPAFQRALCVRP
jgi:hypothetical protein